MDKSECWYNENIHSKDNFVNEFVSKGRRRTGMADKGQRSYIAIDLKSFYASVECKERELDPMTTNLVVADKSRTEKLSVWQCLLP